nr:hypothetical protein [Tanacetum cinerariifolium]
MEFLLPGEVPTASEESSHCQKKRDATAKKIALLLKSTSNCQSKSYDSYAKDSYEAPKEDAATVSASDGSVKIKGWIVAVTTEEMKKKKNDVKARTTLLLSLPNEHQLRFSKYKTAQELWAAILKTFGGNEATKKTKKNLLKQQSDLDTMSLDDLYNHLKLYESEVQKKSITPREFGDSYEAPKDNPTTCSASDGTGKKKGRTVTLTTDDMQKRKNDVKARTTLLLALPDEHQLWFSRHKTKKELWPAILKTFGGNEATKKTKKNLLKQQHGNFKAEGSETLEQIFNRLQVIVSHLEFMDIEIKKDDLNQKFLTSLPAEWLMHTIVWRNSNDLDTISLDDLYNHLKVYKSEVQKKSESNSQNMAFISSAKHNSGNEEVNTASVSTASTNVSTASANIGAASISQDTACAYIASQSSGKKITIQGTYMAGFDKSKVECFNCHKMGHFARECRAPKSQDRGRRDNYRQGSKVEEHTPKALMAIDGVRWDWSYMENDEENHALDLSWAGLPEFADDTVTDYSRLASTIESSPDDAQNRNTFVTKTEASPMILTILLMTDVNGLIMGDHGQRTTILIRGSSQNNIDDKGYWDNGCSRHMTSNISYLSDYEPFDEGYVSFGQGGCKITSKGTIKTKCIVLGRNFKLSDGANVLLRTPKQHNMYLIDLNNIVPHKDLTCLVAKASADKGMLWHRRLEKQHKAFCMSRLVNSMTKPLHTLHMDLFGPTSDETSGIFWKFISEIENLKDLKVKIIRCDNGREFRNKDMNDFCLQKRIKREFSNARTPQRNGVAKKRNRTLIEVAKTMLADAKLPVTFWAEAVNTACYVQNKVLVNKSQKKTPYELFNGRTPAIGFLKPFGCHVMILNVMPLFVKKTLCHNLGIISKHS